jgi:hypothetical protein
VDRKSAGELQEHMLGTYFGLRMGLATIGLALPIVVLLAGGFLCGFWMEASLSAYYHTPAVHTCSTATFTTRDLFVGGLFAAAACLYLYKGFSTKENVALNLAGVFAVLVALVPTGVSWLHAAAAVLFFLCIAYVSLFRSRDTLELLPEEKRPRYATLYRWIGLAMIAFPLAAVALSYTLEEWMRTRVYVVETLAVWAFAAYWITKTAEMRETQAERLAADRELRREVVPAAEAGEARSGGAPPRSGAVEKIVPVDAPGSPVPSTPVPPERP